MSDIDLLLFGCAISFIALAGFYVYARERFVYSEDARRETQPQPELQPQLVRAEVPRGRRVPNEVA